MREKEGLLSDTRKFFFYFFVMRRERNFNGHRIYARIGVTRERILKHLMTQNLWENRGYKREDFKILNDT